MSDIGRLVARVRDLEREVATLRGAAPKPAPERTETDYIEAAALLLEASAWLFHVQLAGDALPSGSGQLDGEGREIIRITGGEVYVDVVIERLPEAPAPSASKALITLDHIIALVDRVKSGVVQAGRMRTAEPPATAAPALEVMSPAPASIPTTSLADRWAIKQE